MSQEQVHPNSKKITIFRAGSFINDAQTNAQDFMALSKKSIGSYWQSITGKGIGSGLSFEEMDLLLPEILDLPASDRTFRQKVKEFYQSFITRVPYGKGVDLEIGLKKSNSEKVSADNMPIDLMDYLRYRHAAKHPRVAASLEEARGNQLYEFYIFDKDEVIKNNRTLDELKDEALVCYLGVKDDEEKVNMMLTLLGIDPKSIKGKNAVHLREQALRDKAVNDAQNFVKVYKVDNFEDRYRVQAMLNSGILKKIGDQIIDAETTEVIGHTMEEAVYFFKDKTKSTQIGILKSRLQEALKDIMPVKKPKPVAEPKKQEETTE